MDSLGDILKKLRHWVRPWEMGTEPMEVRRAILDEVAGKVVSAGGGKRIFPYNRLRIRLLVSGPEERDQLDAIVREGWNLEEEIRDRIHDQGSDVPPGFGVEVQMSDQEPGPEFGGRRFHIAYERAEAVTAKATAEAARRPVLELTVTKGKATQQVYILSSERIYLGRLAEVIDQDGRVKRRNDVAFLEEGEINQTVSREQARIAWDDSARGYWLRSEPGSSSTRIFRDGRPIEVSRQDRRGVRLQPGDEIYLGRASLKVGMRPPEE